MKKTTYWKRKALEEQDSKISFIENKLITLCSIFGAIIIFTFIFAGLRWDFGVYLFFGLSVIYALFILFYSVKLDNLIEENKAVIKYFNKIKRKRCKNKEIKNDKLKN